MTELTEVLHNNQAHDPTLSRLWAKIKVKGPLLSEAMQLAAVPLHFNEPLLIELRNRDDGLESKMLERFAEFSFLQGWQGRYTFSEEMRALLLDEISRDSGIYRLAHRRALSYFEAQLEKNDLLPWRREEMIQSQIYHVLALDEVKGVRLLLEYFLQAIEERRIVAAKAYLDIARKQALVLSPGRRFYLDYLDAELAYYDRNLDSSESILSRIEIQSVDPDLCGRVARLFGVVYLAQERWQDSRASFEEALEVFQGLGDIIEIAQTQYDLGVHYLELALSTWGGGETFRPASRRHVITDIFGICIRLPLLIYLMSQLGVQALLPALTRIGRGMDWMIARLFVEADDWFSQSLANLDLVVDPRRKNRVWEQRGRLHLALNNPQEAERIWDTLLEEEQQLGTVGRARANLYKGWSLVAQRKVEEAIPLLQDSISTFVHFKHDRLLAQNHTLLARANVLIHSDDIAVEQYRLGWELSRKIENRSDATDILHELQNLSESTTLSSASAATIAEIEETTVERFYRTRFHHPVLEGFQRFALSAGALVLLITLLLAIQPVTTSVLDASLPVVEKISAGGGVSIGRPELALFPSPTPKVQVDTSVLWALPIASFFIYLVLYSGIGYLFIRRVSRAEVEDKQQSNLVVTPTSIDLVQGNLTQVSLKWLKIDWMTISDRFNLQDAVPFFSHTLLLDDAEVLSIDGYTRNYARLQRTIKSRIGASVEVERIGIGMGWGIVGIVALFSTLLILVLLLLSKVPFLSQTASTWRFWHYSVFDLLALAYIGLTIAILDLFVLEPLRLQLRQKPTSKLLWWIGAAGLAAALASSLPIWLSNPITARPEIVMGVVSLFLLFVFAYYIVRLRHRVGQDSPYVYPLWLRVLTVLAVSILCLWLLFSNGRELMSHHYYARGMTTLMKIAQAQAFSATGHEELESSYRLRPLSESLRIKGHISMSKNPPLYEEARDALERALKYGRGTEEDYLNLRRDLALAHIGLAATSDKKDNANRLIHFSIASAMLSELLKSETEQEQIIELRRMRAAINYALGRTYHDMDKDVEGSDSLQFLYFMEAEKDYDWLLQQPVIDSKDLAADYTGRGWAKLFQRYEYGEDDPERNRQSEEAVEDFQIASELDSRNISALSGLGWANYYSRSNVGSCESAVNKNFDVLDYINFISASVNAFGKMIELEPEAPHYYRTRAQIRYLLRDCGAYSDDDEYASANIYEASARDYSEAIALIEADSSMSEAEKAKILAPWYNRKGTFYYAIGLVQGDEEAIKDAFRKASEDYAKVAIYRPDDPDIWLKLRDTYRRSGRARADALDPILLARGNNPESAVENYNFGQFVLRRGYDSEEFNNLKVPMAINAFERSVARDPSQFDALYELASIYFQRGRYEESIQQLERALELKPDDDDALLLHAQAACVNGDYSDALKYAAKVDRSKETTGLMAGYIVARARQELGYPNVAQATARNVLDPIAVSLSEVPAVLMDSCLHSHRSGLFVASRQHDVALDGIFDEWSETWDPIDNVIWGEESHGGKNDLSAEMQLAWSAQGLYLALQVKDQQYVTAPPDNKVRQGDAIEINLDKDLQGDYQNSVNNSDDYQIDIRFGPSARTLEWRRRLPKDMPELDVEPDGYFSITNDGYVLEMLLPWQAFGIDGKGLAAGSTFGFALSIDDRDDSRISAPPKTIISTSELRTRRGTSRQEWGTLILR